MKDQEAAGITDLAGAGIGEVIGLIGEMAPGFGGGTYLLLATMIRVFGPALAPVVAEYFRHKAGLHKPGAPKGAELPDKKIDRPTLPPTAP